ncbi:mitogen-activated protein kinase kinase kinase kinase 5 [Rhagoletis pomonella]|uniref:mitogen-activated protein kinase kinase kinase kinase 5 n=1 Tax=Rhagoletis pomonella TaxID=28610 RepID=UPI001784C3FB|nr:mitogen-activated protein kinase kinase kinase kinase 5 [Rhagoletis pomonella]
MAHAHHNAANLLSSDISRRNPQDEYELIQKIGSGTYGDVYKAKRIQSNELAAIKVIKLEPTDDIQIIQQEIIMMRDCRHKNIITYYGSYLRRDKLWICMEYCGGGSLQDIYQVTGPLAEQQIAYMCRETLKGLEYLHTMGKMHRDIKGANILLTEQGDVKLADFGVSAQITATINKRKSFIVGFVKQPHPYRATLPLTDTKDLLSTECHCARNSGNGNGNGGGSSIGANDAPAPSAPDDVSSSSTTSATATSAATAATTSVNGGSGAGGLGHSMSAYLGLGIGFSNLRTTSVDAVTNNANHDSGTRYQQQHTHVHQQQQQQQQQQQPRYHQHHHHHYMHYTNNSNNSSNNNSNRNNKGGHGGSNMHSRSSSATGLAATPSSFSYDATMATTTTLNGQLPHTSLSSSSYNPLDSFSCDSDGGAGAGGGDLVGSVSSTNGGGGVGEGGLVCGVLGVDRNGGSGVGGAVGFVGVGSSVGGLVASPSPSSSTSAFARDVLMHSSASTSHLFTNLLRNNGANYFNSNTSATDSTTTIGAAAATATSASASASASAASAGSTSASASGECTPTSAQATGGGIDNNCDYRHESIQNGLEDSPRRHSSMDQLIGLLNDMGKSSRTRSLSDGGTQEDEMEKEAQPDLLNNTPPVPPKRSHRRRHTPPRPISNGLPPTPKVHMGACFSKIFNGCPLRIHCTASWIHPETRDQHLLIGADEGIFNLNMNELHDAVIDQLFPRRTTWLYVIKDVLMSLSGKSCQLYRHDLIALHSKQTHRFSLHMNKIPERLVPRKFALTTKVPDTKGCTQCCVTRNPYNGYKYLCGATPSGIFLMQWYDPLNKFMLLKQCEWPATSILGGGHGCVLNGHTPVFEMIITPELEYPIVCTGVRKALNGCLKLELINMNSASWFHSDDLDFDAMATMVPRRDLLKVVKVHQVEKDAILVCYGNIIQVVTLQGNPKQHKKMVSQLNFDFSVDSIVCLPDSVLAFHKHGMQGKSLRNGEITQEIKDMSRTYRLLGCDKVVALESQLLRTGSLGSEEGHDLYILAGHEASY